MDKACNFELEPEMQMENFVSQCSVNSSVTQLPFLKVRFPHIWFVLSMFIAVNMRNGSKVRGRAHQAMFLLACFDQGGKILWGCGH